ncbi:MAG: Flp pilus assembly complex ATPase component TadA [Ignavibacteriales bacterium]|nr:Flp pilus assembly complex ATPase component TadA [Ignavibacteriales bacterium]
MSGARGADMSKDRSATSAARTGTSGPWPSATASLTSTSRPSASTAISSSPSPSSSSTASTSSRSATTNGVMKIAVADPSDIASIDAIEAFLGRKVKVYAASKRAILEALRKSETAMQVLRDATEGFVTQVVERESGEEEDVISIEKLADQDGSIIKLVNTIIFTAVQKRASDVHIESKDDDVKIKFRIDGVLGEAMEAIDKKFQSPIISRIKVMSDLDIAERRVPQDGRFRLQDQGQDHRLPRLHHALHLRRGRGHPHPRQGDDHPGHLASCGSTSWASPTTILQKFRKYIAQPYGMVLVTGPTGSGKTTTPLRRPDRDQVARGQDRHHRGPGRVPGRRHHPDPGQREEGPDLRPGPALHPPPRPGQDHGRRDPRPGDGPDRHPVGPDRPPRLHDRPRQQRLRRHRPLPAHAGRPLQLHLGPQLHPGPAAGPASSARTARSPVRYGADAAPASRASTRPGTRETVFYEPKGCAECNCTGYQGRTAIAEILELSDPIRELILEKQPLSEVKKRAKAEGMAFLREVGMEKVLAGLTGLKDLNKVTFVE